jgi:RimJ/RimL family protein N-acetyltransferase
MNIEVTTDMELVNNILKTPEIWSHVAEDDIDPDSYYPEYSPMAFWLLAKTDEIYGIIYVIVETSVSILIHPYMLEKHKGKGIYMMKAFLKWFLANTNEKSNKINTRIPSFNKLGRKVALKLNFKEEGINRKVIKKTGNYLINICLVLPATKLKGY